MRTHWVLKDPATRPRKRTQAVAGQFIVHWYQLLWEHGVQNCVATNKLLFGVSFYLACLCVERVQGKSSVFGFLEKLCFRTFSPKHGSASKIRRFSVIEWKDGSLLPGGQGHGHQVVDAVAAGKDQGWPLQPTLEGEHNEGGDEVDDWLRGKGDDQCNKLWVLLLLCILLTGLVVSVNTHTHTHTHLSPLVLSI